jgi:excisionase family DNA binding protein
MGERGRRSDDRRRAAAPPIPCEPVDLLAGIAPGVELAADEVVVPGADAEEGAATMTVAEAGKLLRSGDDTVRRLIRNASLRPASPGTSRTAEVERAGVPPRSRQRPGE